MTMMTEMMVTSAVLGHCADDTDDDDGYDGDMPMAMDSSYSLSLFQCCCPPHVDRSLVSTALTDPQWLCSSVVAADDDEMIMMMMLTQRPST